MRKALLLSASGLAIALGGVAGNAGAQTGRPFDNYTPRPTVSPYMNLANNGNNNNGNPFLNYQLLVRPQLEQRNANQQSAAAIKQLQQHSGMERSHAKSAGNPKLRATGHAATRVNYSHYFPAMKK